MLTSRSATSGQPGLKYNYKSHVPSARKYYSPYTLQQKKQSRHKSKKDQRSTQRSTTHHSSHNFSFNKEKKEPLKEIYQNFGQCLDLAEVHKKQSLALRKRNETLEQKCKYQNLELQKMKLEMIEIKKNLNKNEDDRPEESNELVQQAHHNIEGKAKKEPHKKQNLRQKVQTLRTYEPIVQPQFNFEEVDMSKVEDSNQISRRKQYMKYYESATVKLHQQCQYPKEQTPTELKEKYTKQLRRLENEVASLKQNGLMVQVLEQQVQNKNNCIDFLRNQLETMQTNAHQLLLVIDSLERKMQAMEIKAHQKESWRQRPVSSFHTFSDCKY